MVLILLMMTVGTTPTFKINWAQNSNRTLGLTLEPQ